MRKILFTATVDSHILTFHLPYLQWFKNQGFEVHVASNGNSSIPFTDTKYDIPFERSPYKFKKNLLVYSELKNIIEKNTYDLIHCHTPMGSVLTRLASINARKNGTKVIYTAHGFHFYRGASMFNNLIYFAIEKWLSKYTDTLITINQEDYERALETNFNSKQIIKIDGVGVNLEEFLPQTMERKNELRKVYGFNEEDFILIYVAELSFRKHQDLLINAISHLKEEIPHIKLLLAGTGKMHKAYENYVLESGLKGKIEFLGYRNDISKLMTLSDVSVSSSRQEGLPVNILEAMATGLPIVATNCRGNRDLIHDGQNGYIVEINDTYGMAHAIKKLYLSKENRDNFSKKNIEFVERYSLEKILKDMEEVYDSCLAEKKIHNLKRC